MYDSESCIQPMFHLKPKPSPPAYVGCVTPGHAVDSSAMITVPGLRRYDVAVVSWRRRTASRFSRPPFFPLKPKPGPAGVRRLRAPRPRRRLLGDDPRPGVAAVRRRRRLLEEAPRVEFPPPAVLVGRPLAVLARVVEVEHRRDG